MTTNEESPSQRTRLMIAAFSFAWGVAFFHFLTHNTLWLAVVLGALVGLTYLLRDEGRERVAKLACISAFGGLSSWLVVGLGPVSIAVALVFPATYVAYEMLERRHSGT